MSHVRKSRSTLDQTARACAVQLEKLERQEAKIRPELAKVQRKRAMVCALLKDSPPSASIASGGNDAHLQPHIPNYTAAAFSTQLQKLTTREAVLERELKQVLLAKRGIKKVLNGGVK